MSHLENSHKHILRRQMLNRRDPVSYTHLDVYKRQGVQSQKLRWWK